MSVKRENGTEIGVGLGDMGYENISVTPWRIEETSFFGARIVDPKDFESVWGYKYVRFADGRVLFCDSTDTGMSHKKIVEAYDKAPPVAAGLIKVKRKRWAIESGGSTTAKLDRLESDEKFIQKELGPEFTHDVEVVY